MSLTTAALVIIDLQNDFLAPDAPFAVHPEPREAIQQSISSLVPTFRTAGGHIIWIKSNYRHGMPSGELESVEPEPSRTSHSVQPLVSIPSSLLWVLEGTHTGKKPCCQAGTPGAELVDWAAQLVKDEDVTVVKTYYSAFRRTRLLEELVSKGIDTVYISGLLSNMCVLATTLDALRSMQSKVAIVVDGLAWRKETSHHKALETFRQHGVQLIASAEIPQAVREC
ncbi:hypothetical protein PIIN_00007 [Serendipita indica DSM 11827]|uniref:Isochorismatase-like domain-containing protein n=1 Tax=Serendipita indica (strain DSM 11827) TaxID=1109443 RepID=G4T4Z7_SERID|nr:hypothetical protein PIIN_00007 [Serendipita indica DSM 11827]